LHSGSDNTLSLPQQISKGWEEQEDIHLDRDCKTIKIKNKSFSVVECIRNRETRNKKKLKTWMPRSYLNKILLIVHRLERNARVAAYMKNIATGSLNSRKT